jgi:hypothetical protein
VGQQLWRLSKAVVSVRLVESACALAYVREVEGVEGEEQISKDVLL